MKSVLAIETTILHRFRHVLWTNNIHQRHIRDGARYFKNPMIRACRKT